jgi:RNA polymerase sigma-70 factor (ECF subfamily)
LVSEEEFAICFREHYPGLVRLLRRILGSSSEADDLAQEVFVRLFRSQRERGEPAEELVRPWLYRVALNLAYNAGRDRARRERGRKARAESLGRNLHGSPGAPPDEECARRDEQQRVRRVLARLPRRQSELLLLRHSGLSYREVSEALRVAPGSVGTLLIRAEEAFSRLYRREAGHEVR